MNNDAELKLKLKRDMIAIGRLLWEKELVTGLNGNISARVDDEHILITANKACLGLLGEKDILLMTLAGQVLDVGTVSSERLLHTAVYNGIPKVKAILHTHTTYTNAYYLHHDSLTPVIFESKVVLGEIRAVPQDAPSVTDTAPVLAALKDNNIVVLKKHGVVAIGEGLFDCFLLIQSLEEAIKIDVIGRLYNQEHTNTGAQEHTQKAGMGARGRGQDNLAVSLRGGHEVPDEAISKEMASLPAVARNDDKGQGKIYELFSREQMEEIVRLVNNDPQLKQLGAKTAMTMELAVKLEESGEVFSFKFVNGQISETGKNGQAEFLITAPDHVWRAVFNRKIDPFVATTQKKMSLRGDFARISKWYAPCSRIFELWGQVPVD